MIVTVNKTGLRHLVSMHCSSLNICLRKQTYFGKTLVFKLDLPTYRARGCSVRSAWFLAGLPSLRQHRAAACEAQSWCWRPAGGSRLPTWDLPEDSPPWMLQQILPQVFAVSFHWLNGRLLCCSITKEDINWCRLQSHLKTSSRSARDRKKTWLSNSWSKSFYSVRTSPLQHLLQSSLDPCGASIHNTELVKPLRITVQLEYSSVWHPLPLPFCLSPLVSLSGEVMWGTSCVPYLSRPVVPILPRMLAAKKSRRAGRQSSVGECSTRRVSQARALGGLGNLLF